MGEHTHVQGVGGLYRQVFRRKELIGDGPSLFAAQSDDANGTRSAGRSQGHDGIFPIGIAHAAKLTQ